MTDHRNTDPTTDPTTGDDPTTDHGAATEPPPGPLAAPVAAPHRLRRPTGTPLGGVAAGVARYFGIDDGLVRVGFVILAFLGGFGLFAYLAGWVLLRTDDDPDPRPFVINGGFAPVVFGAIAATIALAIAFSGDTFTSGIIVPAALVGIGLYLLNQRDLIDPGVSGSGFASMSAAGATTAPPPPAGSIPSPPPWGSVHVDPVSTTPVAPRPPITAITVAVAAATIGALVSLDQFTSIEVTATAVFAALTAVIGAGLVASGFMGRALGLYPLAAVALVGLLVSVATVDWDVEGFEAGERNLVPTSRTQILPHYDLGAGELILDLRQVEFTADDSIEIDVWAGSVIVHIPDDVTLDLDAHAGAGEIVAPDGETDSGFGTTVLRRIEASEGAPVLDLEIDVAFGSIEVHRG